MKKQVQWFLFPRNTHTKNAIIQGLLDASERLDPSNPMEWVPIAVNKKLPMIPVPKYFFVNFAKRSALDSGYDLVPYVRSGSEMARIWWLDDRKKTARTKKVREVKKKLKEYQLKNKK